MIFFLFLLQLFIHADEVTNTPGDQQFSDAISSRFFADEQTSTVIKELNCIRAKDQTAGSTFSSSVSEVNMKKLAPFIQSAFDKNKMGPKERALFYSQILIESSYFTNFTETENLQVKEHSYTEDSQNELGIKAIIKSGESDDQFNGSGRNAGDFRGRGLIQITGCDNFLSVNHYLNQQYRNMTPSWKHYWYASEKRTDIPESTKITGNCNTPEGKANLEKMLEIYKKNYPQMDLDLYGSIKDPIHFAMPGGDFTDSKLKQGITGEKFMVDASMAYWKGRCGKDIYQFIRSPQSSTSKYCPSNKKGLNDDEIISQCTTKCVKGSTSTWEKRNALFLKAQECAIK